MTGIIRKGGVKHLMNFRPCLQPPCDVEAGCLMLAEPCGQRAQASQHQIGVVGRYIQSEIIDSRFDLPGQSLVAGKNGAIQYVRSAADVFRGGLHGDVDTQIERAVKDAGAPCVVHDADGADRTYGLRDRRSVTDFEGQRSGAFKKHQFCIRSEQRLDAATDRRIEILDLQRPSA